MNEYNNPSSHTFAHTYIYIWSEQREKKKEERKKDNNNKHKKDRYNGIKGMNRCDSPLTHTFTKKTGFYRYKFRSSWMKKSKHRSIMFKKDISLTKKNSSRDI